MSNLKTSASHGWEHSDNEEVEILSLMEGIVDVQLDEGDVL